MRFKKRQKDKKDYIRGDSMNDWTGNSRSAFASLGASNFASEEREQRDYYATPPEAVEMLLEHESFRQHIWEPACGEGHISKVLTEHGHDVKSSDIIDRGYSGTEIIDFLHSDIATRGGIAWDIITNPPYKFAKEFIEQAIAVSDARTKIAMLLKIQFLEGKARRRLFDTNPPKRIWVFSGRVTCAKNGDFNKYKRCNAIAYDWFIWEKGFSGSPTIHWI